MHQTKCQSLSESITYFPFRFKEEATVEMGSIEATNFYHRENQQCCQTKEEESAPSDFATKMADLNANFGSVEISVHTVRKIHTN